MALILSTSRDLPVLSADETWFVYNGLDCCVTQQVFSSCLPLLTPETKSVYDFEMSMQVIALEMMERGLRVDLKVRDEVAAQLSANVTRLLSIIDKYSHAIWKRPLNPNSHAQLKELLYGYMKLPVQYSFVKGEKKVTTNREALEKLLLYIDASPLLHCLLKYADEINILRVMQKPLDNGRMKYSLNVGATETGRWSSSVHPLGTGTNIQNVTDFVRRMFIPDEGFLFVNFDLVTAESLGVAYLSGDQNYLEACQSGDLHTWACRYMWPGLSWTGDIKADREIADRPFYRHFSYRDLLKRGGHLSNYLGTPQTMSQHLRLSVDMCKDFQEFYFRTFPGISTWHVTVQALLQTERKLTTPLGRVRHFFGRLDSKETLKEAVAFIPQSLIVDTINRGALNVYKTYPQLQFLAQGHDSILCQLPLTLRHLIPEITKSLEITTPVNGKPMTIPVEASIGWNWGKMNLKPGRDFNPLGLRKLGKEGPEPSAAQLSVLDNGVPGVLGGDREPANLP